MSQENTASAPRTDLPRFQPIDYRPDGGFAMSGVTMLLSAMAIAGAILGFVVHIVSQFFYLILLFPVLIGVVMGWVGSKMIRSGRVRSPWVGGLAGFVGGALAMFMMHYFDYRSFRSALDDEPELVALAHMTPAERKEALREDLSPQEMAALEDAMQFALVETFPQYMDMEARHGVEIKKTTSTGKGLNLGYTGSYIYWGVEVLIVAGFTFLATRKAAAEPFCVECGEWKNPGLLGFFSGGTVADSAAALQSGDLNAIHANQPTADITNVRVSTYTCPNCMGKGDVDLKLEFLTADNNGKVSAATHAFSRYPAAAIPALQAMFVPVAPIPAEQTMVDPQQEGETA